MPPKKFFKKRNYDGGAANAGADAGSGSSSGNSKAQNEQPQIQFDLGVEKKKVTVRKFKNMKLIDIREYYQKDGNWLPGSKGISLTEDQWHVLVTKFVDINEALNKIDNKEEFNIMKAALDRKQKNMEEEEEDVEYEEQDDEEAAATGESKPKTIKAPAEEEDEDEDIGDDEFEDVSVAPSVKRVKKE